MKELNRAKLQKEFQELLEKNNLTGSIIRNIASYMESENINIFLETYGDRDVIEEEITTETIHEQMKKYLEKNEVKYNEYDLKYYVAEDEETVLENVEYFLEEIMPGFYTGNLTGRNLIENKALKNLYSYLNIDSEDIVRVYKELSKIKNLDETGIVEYVADYDFIIDDNNFIVGGE